jgi:hypothetical protein
MSLGGAIAGTMRALLLAATATAGSAAPARRRAS